MRESAVSAKRGWVSLARNRRSPKRPSEPRPSGVHPEEGAVRERWRSLPFRTDIGGRRRKVLKEKRILYGAF